MNLEQLKQEWTAVKEAVESILETATGENTETIIEILHLNTATFVKKLEDIVDKAWNDDQSTPNT